jgi:hypothetical protein
MMLVLCSSASISLEALIYLQTGDALLVVPNEHGSSKWNRI